MKKFFIGLFIISSIVLISCDKDFIETNTAVSSLHSEMSFDSDQNTIVFNSSTNLKDLYDNLKSEKEEDINLIKEFYKRDFTPMRLVQSADETEVQNFIERKKIKRYKSKSTESSDVLGNDIILNDNFASILNDRGEIQVGDSIYRYTKKGLLITHVSDRELLNSEVTSFLGKNSNGVSAIKTYVPSPGSFQDFSISEVNDCMEPTSDQLNMDMPYPEDDYYGCGGSGGGGSGGGGSVDTIGVPDTSNYNVCVNSKAGWIDNIFGKSYVCEYKFNSKRKLRTIFESNDFYFFQDVYSQAKFKQWTWFGWFSDRSADEVYLLNKKVILKSERKDRGFDFTIKINDAVKVYNEIYKFFLANPEKKAAYVSNVYDFNNKTSTTFLPSQSNLLSNSSNNLNVFLPTVKSTKYLIDVDFNLKDFFGKKVNKAVVINILGLEADFSNTQIIKLSYEALSKHKIDLKKGESGAIVILYQNPDTKGIKPVSYSIFGERTFTRGGAVASRNFDVPQDFRINDFTLLFRLSNNHTSNDTSKHVGLKFKFSVNVVNSVDIEIESGAKYKGVWGGSKFKVKY